ncbi:hypothetical protein ACJVQT_22825, partial [Enterobacter huaxiensis]
MNERELSLIKIIGAAVSEQLKAIESQNAERFNAFETNVLTLIETVKSVESKCAALASSQQNEVSNTDHKITEAIKAAFSTIEQTPAPELPDVAAMVKDAVAAIELPAAPELPDVAALVKDAVAAIELPAAPELPDVAALVKDAVA